MAESNDIRWLTFDVYSALFDFRASLLPELEAMFGEDNADRANSFLKLWRGRQLAAATHHTMLQRGHLSFRRATALALDYALARYGVELSPAGRASLVQAWDALEPWPEAPEALDALRSRGYRLALLSNGDQDMLEALAQRLPGIQAVLSAECAGAYKPHPNVYWYARSSLEVDGDKLLHVAGSATDVMGARAAGLRCAWSNRFNDQVVDPRFEPTLEVPDLAQLPDALDSIFSREEVTP